MHHALEKNIVLLRRLEGVKRFTDGSVPGAAAQIAHQRVFLGFGSVWAVIFGKQAHHKTRGTVPTLTAATLAQLELNRMWGLFGTDAFSGP